MTLLDDRYFVMIITATTIFVAAIYLLSHIFDFIITLYASVITALAFTIALEVRHEQHLKIRYKDTVGIPALRRSLNDALVSLLEIKQSMLVNTPSSVFHTQIINALQTLHHLHDNLLRYSIKGSMSDAVSQSISILGSQRFLVLGEETVQNKNLLQMHDAILYFDEALEEFDTLYK